MSTADRLAALIERMKSWSEWPDEADCGPVLEAALAELRRHEWLLIETAPKGKPLQSRGPSIEVSDGTSVTIAAWRNGQWIELVRDDVYQILDYDGPEWPTLQFAPKYWRALRTPEE